MCQPCGCGFLQNSLPSYPEQIESEVVVDFREAVRENSNLRPCILGESTIGSNEKETADGLAVSVWEDDKQEELENEEWDVIYDYSLVDAELSIDFENKDPLFPPPSTFISLTPLLPNLYKLVAPSFFPLLHSPPLCPPFLPPLSPLLPP